MAVAIGRVMKGAEMFMGLGLLGALGGGLRGRLAMEDGDRLPGCSLYWPSTTTCSLALRPGIDQRLPLADLRHRDGADLDRVVG